MFRRMVPAPRLASHSGPRLLRCEACSKRQHRPHLTSGQAAPATQLRLPSSQQHVATHCLEVSVSELVAGHWVELTALENSLPFSLDVWAPDVLRSGTDVGCGLAEHVKGTHAHTLGLIVEGTWHFPGGMQGEPSPRHCEGHCVPINSPAHCLDELVDPQHFYTTVSHHAGPLTACVWPSQGDRVVD